MKKYIITLILIITAVGLFPTNFIFAQNATSTPDLQTVLEQMQDKINELQAQILELKAQLEVAKFESKFTKTLQRGMTGDEVKRLQEFLKQFTEIYPEGLVTGYFGSLTEKAVKKFQEKYADDILKPYGLTEGTGYVGKNTIAKINEIATKDNVVICNILSDNPKNEQTILFSLLCLGQATSIPDTTILATTTQATTTSETIIPPSDGGGGGGGSSSAAPENTPPPADTTPPIISDLQSLYISENSATISWVTDEPASGDVYYALTSPVLTETATKASGNDNTTAHEVNLSNLASATTYYYFVVSKDSSANAATSSEQSFITLAPPPSPPAPVYIYLYTHTEDHINHALSEERFERILPMMENYRGLYPQYNLSLSIQPYGAEAEVDLKRLAEITCPVHKIVEPKKDIINFLKGFKNRGVVEFGYHGAHEPTYTNNPFQQMSPPYQLATWQQISSAADQSLSWRRDLLYGFDSPAHPPQSTVSGGLKKTQEVFGQAAVLSGIRDDAAVINMAEKYTGAKIMFGFIEHHTGSPIGDDQAYFDDVKEVTSLLSPTSNNPTEIFWMENKLRTSDTDGSYKRRPVASMGLNILKSFLANLDRNKPHVIHMQVADKGIYGAEPTMWAYDNPLSPDLPADTIKSPAERNQKYANTEQNINYLVNEFFPNNPGSRFVSNADLTTMFGSSNFNNIQKSELISATNNLLAGWQSGPPNFVSSSGGNYFSLTDMFQLLVNALADYKTNGALPENTYLSKMYGPLEEIVQSSASFDVAVDSILSSSLNLQSKVNFTARSDNPDYIVPSLITIESQNINAAEFLYLMAETYQVIVGGGTTALPIQLQPSSMQTEIGNLWKTNINKYLTARFIGRFWTLKPAVVK